MKKINLELSICELLMLEVALESKCQKLFELGLNFDRERVLLEKIYSLSPSDKLKRLNIKRLQRDALIKKMIEECKSIDFATIVLC